MGAVQIKSPRICCPIERPNMSSSNGSRKQIRDYGGDSTLVRGRKLKA